MAGGSDTYIFFNGPSKGLVSEVKIFFYQNMHNQYKSAGKKISRKHPKEMSNYSLSCSCSIS